MRLLHLECNCESDTFQGKRKDRRKAEHRPLGDLVNENGERESGRVGPYRVASGTEVRYREGGR